MYPFTEGHDIMCRDKRQNSLSYPVFFSRSSF